MGALSHSYVGSTSVLPDEVINMTTVEEELLGIEQNEQKHDLYYNIDSVMIPPIQKDGKKIHKVKPTILHCWHQQN